MPVLDLKFQFCPRAPNREKTTLSRHRLGGGMWEATTGDIKIWAPMSIALSTNPAALEGSRLLLSQQTGGKGLATLITQQLDTRKI